MASNTSPRNDPEPEDGTVSDQDEDKPLGRDERVSLWPLSFEEVVRALHKTPAAHRRGGQEPPEGAEPTD